MRLLRSFSFYLRVDIFKIGRQMRPAVHETTSSRNWWCCTGALAVVEYHFELHVARYKIENAS